MGMRITETERIQLREVLFGLTLLTHEKHGGLFKDLPECDHVWCSRGKGARGILDNPSVKDTMLKSRD